MSVPVGQILPVFFAAMQNGYAGSASKSSIVELPGSKVIRFTKGEFEVMDCYFVTPHSDFSFGTTTIYYQGNAVWMMQYRGCYPKEIIPFLKESLRQTYERSQFVGGRGPILYSGGGDLCYVNNVITSDWCNFSGREKISCDDIMKGWHEYAGLLLV